NGEGKTMFLPETTLSRVNTLPPKTVCKNGIDFDEKGNFICKNNQYPYFGYDNRGFPCCFAVPREKSIPINLHQRIDMREHIITTDKVLESNRIGSLPKKIDDIFNYYLLPGQQEGFKFFRMGAIQDGNSFL